MYQSPRYPYGSISRWNLALAPKCRFREHHRRHPPPTRSITAPPKLKFHENKKRGERRKFPLYRRHSAGSFSRSGLVLSGTGTLACAFFVLKRTVPRLTPSLASDAPRPPSSLVAPASCRLF